MKVLIFTPQFHQLGGAERSVVELAVELNKRGIHTDILSMYTEDIPGVDKAKRYLLKEGIPAVHFLGMHVHPTIVSMFPAIMRLRRLVYEEGYDVIETSMLSPSVIASWALKGLRAVHVVGIRCVYMRNREVSKQHKFFKFSVRFNSRVRYYAITDYTREKWIKYSRTLPEKSRTIHNSIPDSFFNVRVNRNELRQELGIPEDACLAIYVGRCAAYKGIDTLLNALGPILVRNNMYLLYVGSPDFGVAGTETMLKQMKTLISSENWNEVVRFLGQRHDIPNILASADVLVHVTRTEAFGRTLAEAMAVGLPVVASNVEAVPEVLEGSDSIMVPADDPVALRQAVLKTLHRNPSEVACAIERGRIRAEDFRIGRRTDAMIELFKDVLSNRF
jgi:glycosyltransferase involved in cell wall biosynthesis